MAGVTIGWDESDPANTKNLGLGAGDIRSLKTNLSGGLGAEHVWPTTGGASGAHAKGSAVAFYGAASAVSSSDTEGRLMITSDTSRLYHVASAVTMFLGGRGVVEAAPGVNVTGTTTNSKVSQIWAMECGRATVKTTSASTTVTLQNTYVTPGAIAVVSAVDSGGELNLPVVNTGSITTALVINSMNSTFVIVAPADEYDVNYVVMGFKAG